MTGRLGLALLVIHLGTAASLAAQDAARATDTVPSHSDRSGTGFRDSFERLKSRGYDTYVPGLRASHPSDRQFAAMMLGVVGDRRAVALLESFGATEPQETTRHGGYVGLALLGDTRFVPDLRAALARDLAEYADWVKTGIPDNPLASAASRVGHGHRLWRRLSRRLRTR